MLTGTRGQDPVIGHVDALTIKQTRWCILLIPFLINYLTFSFFSGYFLTIQPDFSRKSTVSFRNDKLASTKIEQIRECSNIASASCLQFWTATPPPKSAK